MSTPTTSPLGTPDAWENVADGYVEDLVPLFEHYARDAVRLAGLSLEAHDLGQPGALPRVLDVGCGPGTATLLAAPAASRIDAVDFAPAMLDRLRARAAGSSVTNITPHLADAQSLPFEAGQFDVAIAMFSVIFCPDRAKALGEIFRVLAPAGRAVIASWGPMSDVPALAAMFTAMNEEIPGLIGGPVALPLSTPALCHAELGSAGFRDIAVHPAVHRGTADSPHAFWWSNARSSAPIVLLRQALGDDFASFSTGVIRRLTEKLGPGPVFWDSLAYLTVARK